MAAVGSPWSARRVGHTALQEVVRKILLTYWNTVAFQSLYGRTAGWTPSAADPAPADRPVLDRWLLSELNTLVQQVDAAMAAFDTHQAGRLLAAFIDDMSNWYVRRSRRRFWRGDPAALATLHEALTTVTLLLAPLTPFITERVWQDMVVVVDPEAPQSVHLAPYPVADESLIDPALSRQMALARRLVELGRAARADSGMKVRQPLSRALASAPGFEELSPELLAEVAAELNVGAVDPVGGAGGSLVDTTAKANFRTLGRRFGKTVQQVAKAIAAADAAALRDSLRDTGSATVQVGDETVTLGPDEVVVTETPREGWAVASEAGATVALDLHLTPELRRAGVARDAIRQIQEARKSSGLEVTDRIELRYRTDREETALALREHRDLVAEEVLATDCAEGEPTWADPRPFTEESLGLTFWIRRS
jgi:isoleucyl-tRNA synthetase